MTVAEYQANYDRIAADHIAHWRATGVNPWQSPAHVEAVNAATARLVLAYSEPWSSILDAGCGMGDLLARISQRGRYGCDLNADYLAIAAERGITTQVADLENLPYPDGHFDLVVCTDVLEHVLDLNHVLAALRRVVKAGGHLVVRTPDAEDLSPYLAPDYPYRFVHLRRFDEPGWRLLLDRVFGMEVVEVERVFGTAPEINVVARR